MLEGTQAAQRLPYSQFTLFDLPENKVQASAKQGDAREASACEGSDGRHELRELDAYLIPDLTRDSVACVVHVCIHQGKGQCNRVGAMWCMRMFSLCGNSCCRPAGWQ